MTVKTARSTLKGKQDDGDGQHNKVCLIWIAFLSFFNFLSDDPVLLSFFFSLAESVCL